MYVVGVYNSKFGIVGFILRRNRRPNTRKRTLRITRGMADTVSCEIQIQFRIVSLREPSIRRLRSMTEPCIGMAGSAYYKQTKH